MPKNSIVTILGTRPQFIKSAPVSLELKRIGINEKILHTGQHFDYNMSDVFFDELKIEKPFYNILINSLPHGAMTGRMLEEIEKILEKEKPKAVIVYGDTNSTLAGALASVKLHIPVIHIEAGLRSLNLDMPEEINRIVTDRISSLLFSPSKIALRNLKREGIMNEKQKVILSGDVMYDSLLLFLPIAENKSKILDQLKLKVEEYGVVTIHREENTSNKDKLHNIIRALNKINKELKIICPLHPRTQKILNNLNVKPEFKIIDPIGYFDNLVLIKNSRLVFTDSGGIQKEAFFLKKPCITLRDETEWVELVKGGVNFLAGSKEEDIISTYRYIITNKINFMIKPYGAGNASRIISKEINKFLNEEL